MLIEDYKLKICKDVDYWFGKLKDRNITCIINEDIHFYFNNYNFFKGYNDTEKIEEIFKNIDNIKIEYKMFKSDIFLFSLLNEYTIYNNFDNYNILNIINKYNNILIKKNIKIIIENINHKPFILSGLLNDFKLNTINIYFHTKEHNFKINDMKQTGKYIELIK